MCKSQITCGAILFGLAVGALAMRVGPTALGQEAAKDKTVTADERTISALIKQLGDDSFVKREAADKQLTTIGLPAMKLLEQAAKDNGDTEIRQRAAQIMRAIERMAFAEVGRFDGHGQGALPWVTRVIVTADGRQAISAGFDDGLRCWDLTTGKQVSHFGVVKGCYWALALSPDGQRLIGGSDNHNAFVFDVRTGKQLQQLVGHSEQVWGAAFLPDGKHAITGAWDQTLRVWDVESGKEIRVLEGVNASIRCLTISPDGKWVAAGHFDNSKGKKDNNKMVIKIWDLESGKEIRMFRGHTKPVTSVSFSRDGKMLLSSSADKTVRLWDTATGKELKSLAAHTTPVEYAAWTPDGRFVVSCGRDDSTMLLWDHTRGTKILETPEVQNGFLCTAVLPDNSGCITAGRDGVVRLWRWRLPPVK
jgi:WD40 repeat protein